MKKFLLLLCTLLGTAGAWAEDVTIANTGSGLPSTWGSFSGSVFTTNAASGLAGVTISASSGLTIGEATVNVANYGKCFSLVTSAPATDYTVTLSVPDGYVITGYSLACSANTKNAVHTLTSEDGTVSVVASAPPYNSPSGPKSFEVTGLNAQTTSFTINTANQGNTLYLPTFTISVKNTSVTYVNVTYSLYEADGTTLVSSEVVEQVANSAIAVPASLVGSTYYNYTTEGTIGDTDCTIKVTRTLKSEIVYPISNLSNNKAYRIEVPRGIYTVNNGQLANTVKDATYDINNFALVSYEDNYYMWSIADSKFVAGSGVTLSDTPAAITFSASTVPSYQIKSGSNTLNATNGQTTGAIFDTWAAADDGNRCVIYEVEDFDPTAVLAALEEYFHPAAEAVFAAAIAELEAINWGTGLNQYSLVIEGTDYTTQAASIISGLKTAGYSADNLTMAQQMLANYALNMPTAGFYRIKGATSSKYLAAGLASNNKFAMTDATDGTTVFYFDGYQLINLASGYSNGMTASAWAWVLGENASTVVFHDGLTNGGYAIQSAAAYFYDNGDGTNSADRGSNLTIAGANPRYVSWYLEEVTELPVAISAAGYATLCAPVALTVPSGVTANTVAINADGVHLDLTPVTTIPAGTAVILEGAAGTYNFAVDATNSDAALTSALTGVSAAIAAPVGSYVLQNKSDVVGFYQVEAGTIPNVPGFRAYIPAQGGSVKAFFFGGADAIEAIGNGQGTMDNAAIYNVAGQRISNLRRGINIVGGKKVVVK